MAQILSPLNTNNPTTDFDPFEAFGDDFEDPFESSSDTSEASSVVSEDSDEPFDNPFEEGDLVSETSAKTETPEQASPTQETVETAGKSADTSAASPAQEKKPQLHADNPTEQRLLDYYNQNASEVLKAKVLKGKKTIQGAFRYIYKRARDCATNSCAMVEDAVVFGWLIHYLEEDKLDCEPKPEESKPKAKKTSAKTSASTPATQTTPAAPRPDPKPTPKPKPEPADEPLDIFSLFEG